MRRPNHGRPHDRHHPRFPGRAELRVYFDGRRLHGSVAGLAPMKPPRIRWNTTEARVERFVRLAQRLDLPVYGFEVRGRDVTVLTRPRDDAPAERPAETDPVARWFRDNAAGEPESAQKRKKL